MDNQKLVGEKIRIAREEAGLTLEQLGKSTGFSAMGLSYLEKGQRGIKISDLENISRVLNRDISFFLDPISSRSPVTPSLVYRRGELNLEEQQILEEKDALKRFDDFISRKYSK